MQPKDHCPTLLLYGTSDCHLCEEAMDILNENNINFEFIDITYDNNLVDQLGWYIPVLKLDDEMIKSPIPWDETLNKINETFAQRLHFLDF